jgi:hypothetical protein
MENLPLSQAVFSGMMGDMSLSYKMRTMKLVLLHATAYYASSPRTSCMHAITATRSMHPRCNFAANAGWLGIATQNVNETIGNDTRSIARIFA